MNIKEWLLKSSEVVKQLAEGINCCYYICFLPCQMFLEGDVLQVIAELKEALSEVNNTDEGWDQINYFQNNIDRMNYEENL